MAPMYDPTLTFARVWAVLSPEVVLVLTGFLIMVLDLFLPKQKKTYLPVLGLLALVVSFGLVLTHFGKTDQLANIMVITDDYGNMFKLLFLAGTFLTLLMSHDFAQHVKIPKPEYTYVLLFATVGAMFMASALDLITLFVGLELLSLSSYILVAIHRSNAKATEGGMKYLIIGGVASALFLYGASFVYGLSGTTNIAVASQALYGLWFQYKALILISFVLILAGVGIKLSIAPFHMWTPDTYEGAPTPITSFLATVSKAAGFAFVFRIFIWGYSANIKEWYMFLVVLAALSMIVGNLAAMTAKNIKRMMAYSSIAQAGYLLVPLAVLGHAKGEFNLWQSISQMVFYLAAYIFATAGAFAIISVVNRDAGNETIDSFAGLYKRSPFLAIAMSFFLLSMAGLPITAGFFGKVFIIFGAINGSFYWLAAIMFVTSVASFYYYIGVMKRMFVDFETALPVSAVRVDSSVSVTVWISLLVTVVLGIVPNLLMNVLNNLKWFG
jgi:NADH-quinone oxidoreductase subunit N